MYLGDRWQQEQVRHLDDDSDAANQDSDDAGQYGDQYSDSGQYGSQYADAGDQYGDGGDSAGYLPYRHRRRSRRLAAT
jgi:hypothetical protein